MLGVPGKKRGLDVKRIYRSSKQKFHRVHVAPLQLDQRAQSSVPHDFTTMIVPVILGWTEQK
jgi:hypothetical protein